MFEPDESKLIKKRAARAFVSTESGRCPGRLINLTPNPVQLYHKESFGVISPAEKLEQALKSGTMETTMGRVFPVTVGKTTAPSSGAIPSDPMARLGQIEPNGVLVNPRQVMGPLLSGTPEVSGPQDRPVHLIELRDRLVAHLSTGEARRVSEFLPGFQEVFA